MDAATKRDRAAVLEHSKTLAANRIGKTKQDKQDTCGVGPGSRYGHVRRGPRSP